MVESPFKSWLAAAGNGGQDELHGCWCCLIDSDRVFICCGVRFDLESKTAANYKQRGPPWFTSNCLSVHLSGERGANIQTCGSPLASYYSCRWLINTFALALTFPPHWCHPVILMTSMSPHSIQSTMSSRSITIVSSGRSAGLDYSGNLLFLIPIRLFFMSLKGFKLIFATFFVSRVEDAWHSSLLTAQSPAGGGQGVRHRLHPWPQQQLLQTYQSPPQ